MNQYIYKLINLLYSKDMQLYENTRHFYTYEQQLNRTFNKENNIVVFPNGNFVTDKVYYSELKNEYKLL